MSLLNMPGVARPVRMPAKSSLATSTAFSIFSSASSRVSSIMSAPSRPSSASSGRVRRIGSHRPLSGLGCGVSKRSVGGDERPDLLTADGALHVAIALHAEHDHGQLVLHAEAEGRGVHHSQPLLEGLA